ncbi:unnamed protein product, partial [Rotaria magnacalcarata]
LKLKPKAIIEVLHECGITTPSIHQLNNFLRTIKSTKLDPTSISLGEIEQWCLKSSQSIPESDDAPFFASYQIIYDDDGDINENNFRFFITIKRLLQTASISKKIHADATYKLVWQGFPVLIIGATDLDRHFHLFGMAICSNEATQDFRFIFRALQKGMKKLNLEEIDPDFLIADDADAIRVGHFTPSTNNALEATNNVIKKEHTLRERLPLSRFKVLAFEIVEKWSKCYE